MLGDIATLTGGTVISEDLGMKLENVTLERAWPGEEDHRRQGQHDDRRGRRQAGGQSRSGSSRFARQIEAPTSDYDREKLQERLAKLTGGVAIVSVGASTRGRHEAEEGPRRRRAARHPRGGRGRHSARRRRGPAALQRSGRSRPAPAPRATRRSASTSCSALLDAPLKQIVDNCGVDGSVVADEVSQKPTNIGYDANTGEYVDMFKAGIIDPHEGRAARRCTTRPASPA